MTDAGAPRPDQADPPTPDGPSASLALEAPWPGQTDPPGPARGGPPEPAPDSSPASLALEAPRPDQADPPGPGQAGPPRLAPGGSSASPALEAPPGEPPATTEAKMFPDPGAALFLTGLHPALAMLRQAVSAAPAAASKKEETLSAIETFWPYADLVAMKLSFVDRTTRRPATAHLSMQECKHPHNLDAELDKLRPRVPAERWSEVLNLASALLFATRRAYEIVAAQTRAALLELYAQEADQAPKGLRVDPADSTLFLKEEWPLRAGLRVNLESES